MIQYKYVGITDKIHAGMKVNTYRSSPNPRSRPNESLPPYGVLAGSGAARSPSRQPPGRLSALAGTMGQTPFRNFDNLIYS